MNRQVFKVHPIMIPIFLFFYLSGEFALYAIVFGSLLFHEAGHLLAAKLVGARVQSCTILPYGGEIKMEQFAKLDTNKQLFILLLGPFFTFILLVIGMLLDFPQNEMLVVMQQLILVVNLLPIFPLDGGRVIYALVPAKYATLIILSLLSSLVIFFISLNYFPKALSITIIFFFLACQNYAYWRFRKYKYAFERIMKTA
jgi:stage IV sporulation protein FB